MSVQNASPPAPPPPPGGGLWSMRTSNHTHVPLTTCKSPLTLLISRYSIAGHAARYVTGATLVVDGGEWMYRTPLIPREAVSKASRGTPLGLPLAPDEDELGQHKAKIKFLLKTLQQLQFVLSHRESMCLQPCVS